MHTDPDIETKVICLECEWPLHTTQAEIDRRIKAIEALEPGDARKGPSSTIQAWCINPIHQTLDLSMPHLAFFIGIDKLVQEVELPA